MKTYDKYKPSGIPWIGQIPEHWEVKRNKTFLKPTEEIVGDRKNEFTLLSLTKQGVIVRDLSEGKGKFPKDYDTYLVVRPNNIVFCLFDMDETPRTVGLVKNVGMLTGAYTNFEINPKIVLPQYIYYFYEYIDDIKGLKPYYSGLRKVVKRNTFLQLNIPLPPVSEQEAIVSYLDGKTARIDQLLGLYGRQEQLLAELKQTTIAHAVTHGLNPNTPTKPTNIPWLKEIPQHWEIVQLRKLLKLVSRKGYQDKQLLSITREQGVIVRNVESKEENHNAIPEDLSDCKLVEKGDFAINKMKAWQGSYGVSEYEGIVSAAYYVCKLSGVDGKFFSLAIRSKTYVSFFAQYSKGIRVGQWDLSPIALKEIPFFLPPLSEQQEIVAYINEKCEKIDRQITSIRRQIELLQEYKQRLIADLVTGHFKPNGEAH